MALSPGTQIADYRVISQLGQGGMGEVYLVENPQLERREALKVISVAGAGIPVSSSGSPMRRGPRPS